MLCSIIITNHNYGKFLDFCIKSCLNQSFDKKKYEIVIVDDNSSDNSDKILNKYSNYKNIKIIKNKKNLGVAKSSNIGIENSRGDFVVRVDSDDYISNDFLKILYLFLIKRKEKFCVSCDYTMFLKKDAFKEICSSREKPVSCGIMYRKKELLACGIYNPTFRHREEEELRQRMGSQYKIGYVDIPLYWYRMHKKNKTKQKKQMKNFKKKVTSDQDIEYPINYEGLNKEILNKDLLKNVIAIIPAKGHSKRLENKNIYPIKKKPMIYWVIKSASKSKYIKNVYVSSEDMNILNIAKKNKAKVIKRPKILSQKNVYKMDVIVHAFNKIKKNSNPTLVCSIQANSPDLKTKDIDAAIEHLVKNNLNEVITTNRKKIQNSALRVMKVTSVYQRTLSTNVGFYQCEATDIHTIRDIKKINKHNLN